MTTKLWGIPGTSSVPSPEKKLKDLIKKYINKFESELKKVTNKFSREVNEIEAKSKQSLVRTRNEIKNDLHFTRKTVEQDLLKLTEEAKDVVEDIVGDTFALISI